MPNSKSAAKRLRQSLKRKARNLQVKERLLFLVRKIKKSVKEGSRDKALEYMHQYQKLVDKAAKKNIYHPNKAARKKSRLMKIINNISEGKQSSEPERK